MSLVSPTSTIKLFNVPWSKEDKNFKQFDSRATQTTRFNEYFSNQPSGQKYSGTEFNIIKDGVIKIPVCAYNVNKYNYMMFSNPDITSSRTYWYAFVDKVEWGSYNTAVVYYTLDAWQNYQFDITFKTSLVERMHITVTEDENNYFDYTAPEPVGFPASYGKILNPETTAQTWAPQWNLNTVSTFGVGTGSTIPFYYGGYGEGTENATGGYTWPLNNNFTSIGLYGFLDIFRDSALFQKSHLDEVINLTPVPKWVEDGAISQGVIGTDTYSEYKVYKLNKTINLVESVSNYNKPSGNTLACGYEPRNKKLLTSLGRVFVVSNVNGLKIPFKPELMPRLSDNTINIVMYYDLKPINCNKIRAEFAFYNSNDKYFNIPYGATLSIGYNSNQGIAGLINKITSITSAGMSVASTAGSVASGNVAGAVAGGLSTLQSIGNVINAFDSVYKQIGSCSDVDSVTKQAIRPQYWDFSPNEKECEYIDNYLDVYGYAVNKRLNPADAISTRNNWNYIKVAKLNAKINAPDNMANVIRQAFETGCTIWHGYIQNVGDYTGNNRS